MNTALISSHIPPPGKTETVVSLQLHPNPASPLNAAWGPCTWGLWASLFLKGQQEKLSLPDFQLSFLRTCKELEVGKISERVLWRDDRCKCRERGDPEDGTLGLVHTRQLLYHKEAQPGYCMFNLRLRKDSRFWRPSHSTPARFAFHASG